MKRRGFVRAVAGAAAALGLPLPHRGETVTLHNPALSAEIASLEYGAGGGFLIPEEMMIEVTAQLRDFNRLTGTARVAFEKLGMEVLDE